jgi:hypothetical protein
MSQQTIGIGSAANDGTGDPLRTAWIKANSNFDELYAILPVPGPEGPPGPQGPQGVPGPAGVVTANAPLSLTGTTLSIDLSAYAPLASPTFTGDPKAPTPALSDSDTSIATTAYVQGNLANYAPLANLASYAPLASPALTGNPTAPTPTAGDNDTSIATTAFVNTKAGNYLPLTGGTLTGQLAQTGSAPTITLNTSTGSGAQNQIEGQKTGSRRWLFQLGDGVAETGGNVGSNFQLYGYDDGGAGWNALQINRQTRKVTQYLNTDFVGNLSMAGTVGITNATPSSSPASGALQIVGGLGVQGRIYSTYGFFANGGYFGTSNPMPPTDAGINIGYAGGGTQYGLALRPAADSTNAIYFYNAAGTNIGSISQTASNVAYNTSSDERLKTDLLAFDAGPIIDQTKVWNFAWRETGERGHGVIAQEAVLVFPEAVTHSEREDTWAVDYSKYIPVLLQELKALRARVADLEAR